ncbi:MAG: arylesterase [Elusimicrobiota bacterium]
MKRAVLLCLALASCSPTPAPKHSSPAAGPTALFVGDSLTAGYGVEPEEAWPALIQEDWKQRGLPWRARNAAVSGATSAGAAEEVAWALTPDVKLVFVCIGGNDGLRGASLTELKKNVSALIAGLQKRGLRVALAGMRIPPNYGDDYAKGFASVFPELARENGVAFMPFLLDGVAADPALNQADGIHPNAAGHRRVAASVAAFLDREGLLK